MTGRELIVYIMQNHLEDEPIYKNGTFIGFLTVPQAAVKMGIGPATITALVESGNLNAVKLYENLLLIPGEDICKK